MRERSWRFAIPCVAVMIAALALAASCGRAPQPRTRPDEPVGPRETTAKASPMTPMTSAAGHSVQISCGGTDQPVTVGTTLPMVPTFQPTITLDSLQCDFDVFSWNSLLALSHSPSGDFGDRDGDNVTIWETWPNEGDIFLPAGVAPPDWPAGEPPPHAPLPPACEGKGKPGPTTSSCPTAPTATRSTSRHPSRGTRTSSRSSRTPTRARSCG